LDDADFRQIVQFVFGFIQTDAETVSLIEKLCHRFTSVNNVQQWRDIACCLSMLSFNEKGIKKLFACAPTYKELCHDDVIYLHFAEMIKKSKSQATQAALEVQKIIDECYMKHHPNSSLPTGEAAAKGAKKGKKGAAAGTKAKRKRKGGNDDDDDDEVEEEESSLEEEEEDGGKEKVEVVPVATAEAAPVVAKKKAPAKKAQPKKRAPAPKVKQFDVVLFCLNIEKKKNRPSRLFLQFVQSELVAQWQLLPSMLITKTRTTRETKACPFLTRNKRRSKKCEFGCCWNTLG
jgi:hypothetical protein